MSLCVFINILLRDNIVPQQMNSIAFKIQMDQKLLHQLSDDDSTHSSDKT
jgi:hypothetical protein